MTLQEKIRGCFVGGAVGDALGYPVEFRQSVDDIQAKYGPKGITRFDLNSEGVAEFSDDTQMSLFTANGFLNAIVDSRKHGFAYWPTKYIRQAYIEWYYTQCKIYGSIKHHTCWISDIEELWDTRGPGMTCLQSLKNLSNGKRVANYSKGNGGIMHTAPIAMLAASQGFDIKYATQLACDCARLTHLHPMGYLSAGLMTYVLYRIFEANDNLAPQQLMDWTNEAIDAMENMHNDDGRGCYISLFPNQIEELRKKSRLAYDLALSDTPNLDVINQFDGGWTGENAWYISLYCTLRHIGNFEDAVVTAVNHSGDSDFTGAITGNLMGAIHGYSAIPEYYKQKLELHDVIIKMADDLYVGTIRE